MNPVWESSEAPPGLAPDHLGSRCAAAPSGPIWHLEVVADNVPRERRNMPLEPIATGGEPVTEKMTDPDKLSSMFVRGRLSRREFIERMAALGAVAAIPGALRVAEAATPRYGGHLRVGALGAATNDTLNPGYDGQCCNAHTLALLFSLRNCLVIYGADGKPAPECAESWESSENASVWTFRLRKGVEFHNGKTMDANDVVWSMRGHMGEDTISPAKPIMEQITDVRADGKDTVVFTLEAGNADFPVLMSDYHLQIVPADGDPDLGTGTGPFILETHEPGVRMTAKRNPNYFKEGLPYFDSLEHLGISDIHTKTSALKTGEVDLIDQPDLKTVNLLERDPGIQVFSAPGFRHYTLPMHTDKAPFDDNDVRLAMKYIMPREQILDKVLRGWGQVGNDHPISPANRCYASEIPQREFDPDRARFHLKKACMENHHFQVWTSDTAFGGAIDSAVLVAEAASKHGIHIEVIRTPADGYWSEIWLKKPWTFCYWSGRPTEDWMFSTAYAAGAKWNDAYWKHERFNELLVKARSETDDALRREMYVEMQQIVRDEGGTIVPLFSDQVGAATTKLKYNAPLTGHYPFDGQRAFERWWFA